MQTGRTAYARARIIVCTGRTPPPKDDALCLLVAVDIRLVTPGKYQIKQLNKQRTPMDRSIGSRIHTDRLKDEAPDVQQFVFA